MNIQEALSQPTISIIDVREPFEFDMGHVEGALNIPLHTIPSRVEELKSMAKPMILYCASGNRSGQALQFLSQNGLNNLFNGGGYGELEWLMNSMKVR